MAELRAVDPQGIAPPAANYAHAVLTVGPGRTLHTSGVVPVRPDGTVPDGVAEQAKVVWDNLVAMLVAADMTTSDIVSIVTYVVPDQDLGPVMAERDRRLGRHRAASTLVMVPALARPAWKMEIALIAADQK